MKRKPLLTNSIFRRLLLLEGVLLLFLWSGMAMSQELGILETSAAEESRSAEATGAEEGLPGDPTAVNGDPTADGEEGTVDGEDGTAESGEEPSAEEPRLPEPPGAPTAGTDRSDTVLLSWQPSPDAADYLIYRRSYRYQYDIGSASYLSTGSHEYELIAVTGDCSYLDTTAREATLYEYAVAARDAEGKCSLPAEAPSAGHRKTPVVADIRVTGLSAAGFTVEGRVYGYELSRRFDVMIWADGDEQLENPSVPEWRYLTADGEGHFRFEVKTAKHGGRHGLYRLEFFPRKEDGSAFSGLEGSGTSYAFCDYEVRVPDGRPTLANPAVVRQDETSFTVKMSVRDASEVEAVCFAEAEGPLMRRREQVSLEDGILTVTVRAEDHAMADGLYYTTVFAYNEAGEFDRYTFRLEMKEQGPCLNLLQADVGNGDATLLVSEGEALLVDAGQAANAENLLILLKEYGITTLEVLCTHHHLDHLGGLQALTEAGLEIRRLYIAPEGRDEYYYDAVGEELVLAEMARLGVPMELLPEAGSRLTLGSAEIEVLRGSGSADFRDPGCENNNSAWLLLHCGGKRWLIAGDAETSVEEELAASGVLGQVDGLKLNHHGLNTSSSQAFLEAAAPSVVTVSCADSSSGGRLDVFDRVRKQGIALYPTSELGSVLVRMSSDALTVYAAGLPEEEPPREKGDVDGSGRLSLYDLGYCVSAVRGSYVLSETEREAADIDRNGQVDLYDLSYLVAYIRGNLESIPQDLGLQEEQEADT